MEITEVHSSELEKVNYAFEKMDPIKFSDQLKEKVVQWGLKQNLTIEKFRFNKVFSDLSAQDFVRELVNSDAFRSSELGNTLPVSAKAIEVIFDKKKCTELNLNFLDRLEENGRN